MILNRVSILAAMYALSNTSGCTHLNSKNLKTKSNPYITIGEETLEEKIISSVPPVLVSSQKRGVRVEFGEDISFEDENTIRIPIRYWNIIEITEKVKAKVVVEQDVIPKKYLLKQGAQEEYGMGFQPMKEDDFGDSVLGRAEKKEFKQRILDSLRRYRLESPKIFKKYKYIQKRKIREQRLVKKKRVVEELGTEPLKDFNLQRYELIVSTNENCISNKPVYSHDGLFIELAIKGCYYAEENRREIQKKVEDRVGLSSVKKQCRKQAKKLFSNMEQENIGTRLCLRREDDDECTIKKNYVTPFIRYYEAENAKQFAEELIKRKFENNIGDVEGVFYLRRKNPRMDILREMDYVEIRPKNVPRPEKLAGICFDKESEGFKIALNKLEDMYDFWEDERMDDVSYFDADVYLPSSIDLTIKVNWNSNKVKRTLRFNKSKETKNIIIREK